LRDEAALPRDKRRAIVKRAGPHNIWAAAVGHRRRMPEPAPAKVSGAAGTLALMGPEAPSRPRPQGNPAPIKTSGTTTGSGVITPGQVDPASAAAAALEDPNVGADAIMASVAAHTDIAQTVASMPQAHLQLCLGTMQELAKASPDCARAVLLEHPQLCYALLHAQFLLGLSLEPSMPPDLGETSQLRAEAVQRAMVNSKALASGRRGQASAASRAAGPAAGFQAPNAIIPARPIGPGSLGPGAGLLPPPPPVLPNGGSFAKGSSVRPPFDGYQAVKMDTS